MVNTSGMKLYEGVTSSASWRVRWALALKRVSYESVVLDLPKGEHHAVLAGINPMHAVPTLVLDDGRVLTESVAIVEWLEETIPEPALLPKEPFERARVRELVQIINAGTHPLQNGAVRKAAGGDDPEKQRAWCATWIVRGLAAYEEHVKDGRGRFSCGDRLTMADLYLVPQVRNAERFDAEISHLKRVNEIYRACLDTPEAAATDPKRRQGGA